MSLKKSQVLTVIWGLLGVLLACSLAAGQAPPPQTKGGLQFASELAEQVRELQIELASHEAETHERRARRLQNELTKSDLELRRAAAEESSNRAELAGIDVQLANFTLTQLERLELQNLRNDLLSDGQESLRKRQDATRERQLVLSKQLERERSLIEHLRQRLKQLQPDGTSESRK